MGARTDAASREPTPEDAFWSLLYQAGKLNDPEGRTPFTRLPLDAALERLSKDDASEIGPSVRRAALGALAANQDRQLKEYDRLQKNYQQYVDKIAEQEAARSGSVPAGPLDPEQIAGEELNRDVCKTQNVIADGHRAVWVYGRLATQQSLDRLMEWVDPENWVKWGKPMFQEMEQLNKTSISHPPGPVQWHAKYREKVSFAGKPLSTVLSFDFKRTLHWVGMSYDLDKSEDGDILVDRGFLLAHDYGDHRVVEALKIAGFADPSDNLLIGLACPLWTALLREAITPDDATVLPSSHRPAGTQADDSGLGLAARLFDPGPIASDIATQWGEHISDAGKFYGSFVRDVGARLWGGGYKRNNVRQDGSVLFMRLAGDWARAWKKTLDIVDQFADVSHNADEVPVPVNPPPTTERVQVFVPAPEQLAPVAATDFNRIHVEPAMVRSRDLALAPPQIGPGEGLLKIDITINTTGVPSGLYEGALKTGDAQGQRTADAHFYVSKVRAGD
jgi:hypothetical protein